MSRKAMATLLLAFVGVGSGLVGAEPAPSPRPVGGPGEAVAGRTLTLAAPARVRFGQHLDVKLTALGSEDEAAYVRFDWTGPYRTVALELTTDRGEVVPLGVEMRGRHEGGDETSAALRLRPTGPHAEGAYLAPGRYSLRAIVDARHDPFDAGRFLGRLVSLPVRITVEPAAKLTAAETRRLVAELADADPAVRAKAIGRVPPTADPALLAAAVAALRDPYVSHEEEPPSPYGPGRRFVSDPVAWLPVAEKAQHDVLPGQGRAAIAPLLAFAVKPENAAYRGVVAQTLGQLGPDKRSLEYLVALANDVDGAHRQGAVWALSVLGPEAVPALVRIARDRWRSARIRQVATEGTAIHGTAEMVGAFLQETLGSDSADLRRAATEAIGTLGVRAALPEVRRRAADPREEHSARYSALRATILLAGRAEARAFLRTLTDDPDEFMRHRVEEWLAGLEGWEGP